MLRFQGVNLQRRVGVNFKRRRGVNFSVFSNKYYLENPTEVGGEYFDLYAKDFIINDYNTGTRYNSEVSELAVIIKNTFYKNTNDTLNPYVNDSIKNNHERTI